MNPPHQFLQLSLSCPCSPDPAPSSVPPAWPIPSSLLQQTHEVSEDSPHRHLGFFLLLRRKLLQGQGWEHFGPLGWTQQLMRYLKGNDRLQVQVCHIQKGWKKTWFIQSTWLRCDVSLGWFMHWAVCRLGLWSWRWGHSSTGKQISCYIPLRCELTLRWSCCDINGCVLEVENKRRHMLL